MEEQKIPRSKSPKSTTPSTGGGKGTPTASSKRIRSVGEAASKAVQQAAAALESELAAGVAAGAKASERLRTEQRLDEREVGEVVERFRKTAHELVEVVGERISELRTDTTQDLAKRFLTDAHGVLDAVANLATLAPEIVDRLGKAQSGGGQTKSDVNEGGKRPRARA